MSPRIFHIQMGRDGGTERFFVTLAQAFARAGATQGFALRPGRGFAAEVAPLGTVHEGPFMRRTPGGFLAHARLRRDIRAFEPDAVLAWRAPAARLIPRLHGVAKLVRLGDFPAHARHFRHLDAVICNNPAIARHVASLGWTGPAPVISNFARPVVPSPVDRATLDTGPGDFVICAAGRFAANKGFDTLLHAVAGVPDAVLWLIGDGEARGALEALAASLGIAGRVRFAGWVAEPMDYVAAADAFVMPSRDEPLGNALIEAFHAGTASVTTATEGPGWYAMDGTDCLVVPVDAPALMAAALLRLQGDPALRARLAEGARATLDAKFSEQAVVSAYFDLIARLRG
ncbi:glycosyltransferase [Rhodobacterales bacterium HKCCE2091]|nr:glycosyltransferase [Rhodobacterales bacterium HKCCE2091]